MPVNNPENTQTPPRNIPPGNPVFHQYPGHVMPPAQLHRVLSNDIHATCTPDTCEMLRGCHLMLESMGHRHPICPKCTERPPDSPLRPA
jgi:hypothetical protein